MATKPAAQGATGINSQKDRRYSDTFYDQHKSIRFPQGRPWCGEREFLSGSENPSNLDPFVHGELSKGDASEAGQEWDAPWTPEWNGGRGHFYELQYARRIIRIRYDRVIMHDRLAQDQYYLACAKMAAAHGWKEVEYGTMPSYQVTSVIGTPPRSPKIAEAAQAGDPWILGLSNQPNDRLAKLLGVTTEGMRIPEPQMRVEPAAVLATKTNEELIALIANVVNATLDARDVVKLDRERESNRDRMAAARHAQKAYREGRNPFQDGAPTIEAAPEEGVPVPSAAP